MRKRVAVVLGALAIAGVAGLWVLRAGGQVAKPDTTPIELSPEVQELIKGTTLAPLPGEPAEAIKAYLEAVTNPNRPVDSDEALMLMQDATSRYPTSRHAWMGLGEVLWARYRKSHRAQDLRAAVDAYIKAVELMLQSDMIVPRDLGHLISGIAHGLAVLKDRITLDAFFQKHTQKLRDIGFWSVAISYYAQALATLKDPRAEQLYQEIITLRSHPREDPTHREAALYLYADYLYGQGRYQEAWQILEKIPTSSYYNTGSNLLLKGAVLERLGRLDEATVEYQQYLDEVAKRKQTPFPPPPAPAKYRIPGSPLQKGIEFEEPESNLWKLLDRLLG